MTAPFLTDAERHRYRHVNSQFGIAIAIGLSRKSSDEIWQGQFDPIACAKRRARNRVARRSRAINRKAARR